MNKKLESIVRTMPTPHDGESMYRAQFCGEHYSNFLRLGGNQERYNPDATNKLVCDVDGCKKVAVYKEHDHLISFGSPRQEEEVSA